MLHRGGRQSSAMSLESELLHVHCISAHASVLAMLIPCYHDNQCHKAQECRHSIVWAVHLQMAEWTHGLQDPIWAIRFAYTAFSPGSYIQAAEKSYSMVRGGRTREAAALAWERQGSTPNQESYKNWAKSVLDNPAVVESTVKSSTSANNFSQSKSECLWFFFCMSFTGELDHRSGQGDPMCCHKEAPLEEGPVAVLGWVWFLQVCPVSQQWQTGSGWHRVQVCLWGWHIWTTLWETCSWLHFRYCETIISCGNNFYFVKEKKLDNMSVLVIQQWDFQFWTFLLFVSVRSWNNALFSIISDNYTLCIFDQYFLTKI